MFDITVIVSVMLLIQLELLRYLQTIAYYFVSLHFEPYVNYYFSYIIARVLIMQQFYVFEDFL